MKKDIKIRTIEDGFKVKEYAEKSKKVVVIGAGLIGLEVTVIEMVPQIVPRSLDPLMAEIVQNYMEKESINVLLGKPLEK